MNSLRRLFTIFKETVFGWSSNDAMLHAAGIAFYTIFSLTPLVVISVNIAGQVFDPGTVEWRIVAGVEKRAGEPAAAFIQDIILGPADAMSSQVATGIGLILLIYAASSAILQLQASLEAMWGIVPRTDTVRQSVLSIVFSRVVSGAVVLAIGYFVLSSLVISTLWSAGLQAAVDTAAPWLGRLEPALRTWTSPLLYWALFALVFKALPRATIRWRDVLPGAALTALLYWFGNYLISQYLAYSLFSSIYGAASSVMVFLLWVYYSALIILFGAKFTQVFAQRIGVPMVPDRRMMLRS